MKLEITSIDGKKSEIEALDSIFSIKTNSTVVSSVLYKTNANYKGRKAKTKQKNEIRLYECVEFPMKWKFSKTLIIPHW